MRKRIFEIIEVGKEGDRASLTYDSFMFISIIVSIIPLWTHKLYNAFLIIDKVTCAIFIIDYALRLWTADYKVKKGSSSFILYPFTPMAIIDLISILPSISITGQVLGQGFKLLRLLRTLKVFRIFKVFRYSKSFIMITNVFKKHKSGLVNVCIFALAYIVVSALVIFNAEPSTFPTMFDALYWATISLTTVGYGDMYATSEIGKVITMFSAIIGVVIVALPAGIVIAGYEQELWNNKYPETDKNKSAASNDETDSE